MNDKLSKMDRTLTDYTHSVLDKHLFVIAHKTREPLIILLIMDKRRWLKEDNP